MAAAALLACVVLLSPGLGEAQDVFASSGPKHAVEGARDHWLAGSDEFRSNSHCCLTWLQQAYAEQVIGLAYFDAAREATNEEQIELVRLGNEAIGRRTAYLNRFRDCTNAVQHALNVANAGGDATGLMPAGCGPPKADEFGSNGGLDTGVADDWFDSRIPEEVRESSSCCKRWLKKARRKESRAFDKFWASQASGLPASDEDRLSSKAQQLLAQRRKPLVLFSKCVNRVWDDLGEEPVCAASASAAKGAPGLAVASEAGTAAEADPQCVNKKKKLKGYVNALDPGQLQKDKITVLPDFAVTDEPGVDWDEWYRNWIKLIRTEVWEPLRKHFCGDSSQYWVDVKYEVYNDHTFAYVTTHIEGTDNLNGENFAISIQNRFDSGVQNRVPALPVGTKYGTPTNPLKRTFSFRHNAGGGDNVTLGGPPAE